MFDNVSEAFHDALKACDKTENSEIGLFSSREIRDLQNVSNLINFNPTSIAEGLQNVQVIHDFLTANADICTENELLKERIKLLEESARNSNSDETQLIMFTEENAILRQQINSLNVCVQEKDLQIDTSKEQLSQIETELTETRVLMLEKSVDFQSLLQIVRESSDNFHHVYRSITDSDAKHQSEIADLTEQLNLHQSTIATTEASLQRMTAINLEQAETINDQRSIIDETRAELITVKEQLQESNARCDEKDANEQFLLTRLLELSSVLDNIHRLAVDNEVAFQNQLDNAENELSMCATRLRQAELELLSAREALAIADEVQTDLANKHQLLEVYEGRIRALQHSLDQLSTGVAAGQAIDQSEGDKHDCSTGPPRDAIGANDPLEALAYHYEELKMRYRDKRHQTRLMELDMGRLQAEYDALKKVCARNGWAE